MSGLWLELDDQGRILRRSEDLADLFASIDPPVADLAALLDRRTDVRAAVARRGGAVRFGLGRGAGRVTFDAEIDAGASGARLRLAVVEPLGDESDVGKLLLAHTARNPDGWTVTDADGIILWCDDAYARLLGRDRSEIIGRPGGLFRSPAVHPRVVESFWRSLYAMGTCRGPLQLRRSDGVDIPVILSGSAVRDVHGRTTHFVSVVSDMSREREFERARSVDLAVSLLSRVGGDHAHRLNNLSAEIVAVCDRALLSDDPASAGAALDRVLALCAALGELGRHMLALSTTGHGAGPADLGRAARDLAQLLQHAGEGAGVSIEVRTPDEGPWVACSSDALLRACIHLALRSLDGVVPGSPVEISATEDYDDGVLRIRYTPTSTERDALRHLIPDGAVTGPIGNDLVARAYGAGVRLDLEDLRDGQVSVCVRAPLAEVVPRSGASTQRDRPGSWTRALIADDNASLRDLMAVTLEVMFEEVVQAGDGDEVLGLLESWSGAVDLLVLDLRMPNRSGLDVLEEVGRRWPDVRVLVATGAAPEGVAHSVIAAGARALLTKPFRLDELRAVVRSVMEGAEW